MLPAQQSIATLGSPKYHTLTHTNYNLESARLCGEQCTNSTNNKLITLFHCGIAVTLESGRFAVYSWFTCLRIYM